MTSNKTITAATKEQLQEQKRLLVAKLNDRSNLKTVLASIHKIDAEIKELDKARLIKDVNSKYSRLREYALMAFECEQPTEDITANDGSFHKTKVKKYPKIAALPYASATWENGRFVTIRINGEKFQMYKVNYEYGKENTYTRPATFSEFLDLNVIPEQDITIDQYNEMSEKLADLNAQLKKDIETYNNGLKALNYSSFNYWGLIGQHNVHLYEYTPNR